MRGGAEIIYQGVFTEGRWRGIADFLERVPRESRFGDWSYEVADTKLARHPKPYFLLQLCFYSEMVARLQGLEPAQMHVILGTKQREAFRYKEFAAYFRSVRARFEAAAAGHEDTYPYPVTHCAFCDSICTMQVFRPSTRSDRPRRAGYAASATRPSIDCASKPGCRTTIA